MTHVPETSTGEIVAGSSELALDDPITDLVESLKSLRDGEKTVVEIAACGPAAIGPLRRLLFGREPSGLYQPRCWAVDALAALKAFEVLIEFLELSRSVDDPVERTGEEAIVNRAARALIPIPGETVYQLLYGRALRKPLPGIIEALGEYRRSAAIPLLIDALGEDDCHLIAEAALRKVGRRAVPALIAAASQSIPDNFEESESGIRTRARALDLLIEESLPVPEQCWPRLKFLILHPDPRIVIRTCALGIRVEQQQGQVALIQTAIGLLVTADWLTRIDVEDFLFEHFDEGRPVIDTAITRLTFKGEPHDETEEVVLTTLRRVLKRASQELER